ncbi:MAG: type I phosphomannose isomerase catalytic subunit [Muribaculaceae bacterium]
MYILQFKPILKNLLWGGEKIIPYKQIKYDLHQVGESWEISGVKDDESIVANGEYEGLTLSELISKHGSELVGKLNYARFGNEFPLLIKFIDARQDLSIQVHPNDDLAKMRHNSNGKTEMWYVVEADNGAKLRPGFSCAISPQQYEEEVKNNNITNVLKEYKINSGDVFFLPAGRIHSIGAGSFIAEIQQTSNITYRIYDFNRCDANGQCRELHTDLSKDAIDYRIESDYRTHYDMALEKEIKLVSCPYFTTSLYDLSQPTTLDYSEMDSFVVVMCVEGKGDIVDKNDNIISIHQGETILVPACMDILRISPSPRMKILTSYIL